MMLALTKCPDNNESLCSFCKLTSIIAQLDELSRDNAIIHTLHKGLADIMRQHQSESAFLACKATYDLSNSSNVITDLICKIPDVVESIIFLLEIRPNDIKVQYEGLRALTKLSKSNHCIMILRNIQSSEIVIKRTRQMLSNVIVKGVSVSASISNDYCTIEKIQKVLQDSHALSLMKDKCIIS